MSKVILTGDRIMIADAQALTDNADNPEKVRQNIVEVALTIWHVGLDPAKRYFLYSQWFRNLQNCHSII